MPFTTNQILAMVIGASFAAGLNVYATIATLGILAHTGYVPLPPNLHLLESWWVIGSACVMFVIEFFADKIPAFDLIWNALHTFVRVPIAALIGYNATAQLSPGAQMLTAALAGTIALVAHGGKTAVRAAVTPSPEPVSNIGLSFAEDAAAIGLTWFATQHPYAAGGIALIATVLTFFAIRWVIRATRRLWQGARREWNELQEPAA